MKQKSKLYCCFVDFQKAFDSVWRDGIFIKIRKLGIGGKFYSLLKNMYSETTSCVKLRQGLTPSFPTKTGIKQGDNLSPTLFNIFIDDVGQSINVPGRSPSLDGTPVNSLLYADDLLILAHSPKQMQRSLDKLGQYCKVWKLSVNISKTKIIIFRARNKQLQALFSFDGHNIDVVDSYTYLGVTFTYTGNFDQAIKDLQTKAMRAMFKVSSALKSKDVGNCDLNIKLFESMLKPIALYGCQVWSQRLVSYFLKDNFGNFDQLPFEQLVNKMCKASLKVGRYTNNVAARAELGIYPLLSSIATLTVKYWIRILKAPDKLVYKAYQEDRKLDAAGQKNWATLVRTILNRCNLSAVWQAQRVENPDLLAKRVRSQLEGQFRQLCFDQLKSTTGKDGRSGNKLRTYNLLKTEYAREPYLTIDLPVHLKRAITKIRISAHNLEIERGRRAKPKLIPANERVCRHCKDKVEDELHFITECPLYSQPRADLFRACPGVEGLDKESQFKRLLTATDFHVIEHVGIFICRSLNKRNCLLYD
jgi:hypothetical protein